RLPPERHGRRFRHRDDIGRVDDCDAGWIEVPPAAKFGFEPRLRTDERDAEIEVSRRGEGAVDDGPRRLIAAHRVNGYDDGHGAGCAALFLVHRSGLASAVVPAIRAH